MSIGSHTKAQTSEKEKGTHFCWCASSTMYSDQPAGGLQTILRAQTKHSGLFTEHPQSLLSPLFGPEVNSSSNSGGSYCNVIQRTCCPLQPVQTLQSTDTTPSPTQDHYSGTKSTLISAEKSHYTRVSWK